MRRKLVIVFEGIRCEGCDRPHPSYVQTEDGSLRCLQCGRKAQLNELLDAVHKGARNVLIGAVVAFAVFLGAILAGVFR